VLHIDPTTPTGVLDTLGHLAPLALSAGASAFTLTVAMLRDRRK